MSRTKLLISTGITIALTELIFLYLALFYKNFFSFQLVGRINFFVLFAELSVIVIVGIFLAKDYFHKIRLKKLETMFLLTIILVAIFLRLQQPLIHAHFFDEDIYLHEAQMISLNKTASSCLYGWFEDGELKCAVFNDMPALKKGYPMLLALVFISLGQASEQIAFIFNLILGIFTILLTFFIGRLIWSSLAGLISATLLAVLPFHIFWSISASSDIPGLAFLLSAVLFFLVYLKTVDLRVWVLSALCLSYGAFIRGGEYLLVLPVLVFPLIMNKTALRPLLSDRLLVIAGVILSLFLTFNVASILLSYNGYSNTLSSFGHEHIVSANNFLGNFKMIIKYHYSIKDIISLVILGLMPLGFYRSWKQSPRQTILLASICLLMFLFYVSFAFGGYSQTHQISNSRFALIWFTLLVIFAGIALEWMFSWSSQKRILVLATLILTVFLTQYRFSSLIIDRSADLLHKEEWDKIRFQKQNPDCLYVTHVPAQDLFKGFNAISYGIFPNYSPGQLRQSCIMLIKSYVCDCEAILDRYTWKQTSSKDIWQMQKN